MRYSAACAANVQYSSRVVNEKLTFLAGSHHCPLESGAKGAFIYYDYI